MSLADPSVPPAEPRAPAAPAARRRRRRGLGPWATAGFGVLCVLAGATIATWAPAVLPKRPATALADLAPTPELPAVAVQPAPQPLAPLPAPVFASDGLNGFSDRLAELEAAQGRTRQAAASALAAAAVIEASQGARPFEGELAALQAVSPGLDLAALRPLAQTGAPTEAALADSFPDFAARAAIAARAPGERAGLLQRIGYALSRVIILRRVDRTAGNGPDAVLARAERAVGDGDLDAALKTLAVLPAPAREALGPWLARAERRAEIDRRVAALRAQALADLALPDRGQGAASGPAS